MAILVQYANGVPAVKFSLDKSEITIGRGLDNDISVDDEFVSKNHAVIQLIKDEVSSEMVCVLIDNESTNHTYVNNIKVSAHKLDENDKVFIGENEFRFSLESSTSEQFNITTHGFFADDAPGLIHAHIESNPITTTATRHKAVTIALDEEEFSTKIDTDANKRFSRRLSLL